MNSLQVHIRFPSRQKQSKHHLKILSKTVPKDVMQIRCTFLIAVHLPKETDIFKDVWSQLLYKEPLCKKFMPYYGE